MAHRIPSKFKVAITPRELNGTKGHTVVVTLDGETLTHTWTDGTKKEAREVAWMALEMQGLVEDGGGA